MFTMTKSKFNQSEAQRITGKSRTTIKKHMKEGKLSFELDHEGNKVIQASELIRVYGEEHCDFESAMGRSKKRTAGPEPQIAEGRGVIESMIPLVLHDKITDQYEAHIKTIESALEKAQEVPKLLEDKRKRENDVSPWKKTVAALEGQVANKESLLEEEKKRRLRLFKKYRAMEKELRIIKEASEEKRSGKWKLFGLLKKGAQ